MAASPLLCLIFLISDLANETNLACLDRWHELSASIDIRSLSCDANLPILSFESFSTRQRLLPDLPKGFKIVRCGIKPPMLEFLPTESLGGPD